MSTDKNQTGGATTGHNNRLVGTMMATIKIDGQDYDVEEGQNLLQACLGLGLDLPYFCWHPALGSVGACRQCALLQYQNADDSRGRLVMGCMTPVADGQILSIKADNAVTFRAGVIETLMTNHPHDCPVCEEGGECHLQDMTVMSGHHQRRFRGPKRTFTNQDLGPCIGHEMNRCITCYRCLRFYRDYAGGNDLHAYGSRNRIYFGRFEDGTLESVFSGNLVEVCPTGVFTDKTLAAHYSRKWDLQCAPSVCVHCSLGCNTSPGERYGVLKRIQNRYHPQINGYFLCDRGRFGYDFVNHPERIRHASQRQGGEFKPIDAEAAVNALKQFVDPNKSRPIGIGSPRATLESNWALQQLVGPDHFFSGLARADETLQQAMLSLLLSCTKATTLQQVEQADALLVIGEDLFNSAPRLGLSVRQAVRAAGRAKADAIRVPLWQDQAVQIAGQDIGHPLYMLHSHRSELDNLARDSYHASPSQQARLGLAIAHAIDPQAPPVAGLAPQQQALANEIAASLINADYPLLVAGASSRSLELIHACGQIHQALNRQRGDAKQAGLQLVFPESNSLGLALLTRQQHENSLDDAFEVAAIKPTRALILENDLYRRAPKPKVARFLDQLDESVVIDLLANPTTTQANLLLPATSFAESHGTLINNEGRAQTLFPVYSAPRELAMSWQWLRRVAKADNRLTKVNDDAELLTELAASDPLLAPLQSLALNHRPAWRSPRMPHRYSGRTALQAQLNVHEPQQPSDSDSALSYTMEGVPVYRRVTSQDANLPPLPFAWYPGWNSNQALHKFDQQRRGQLGREVAEARLIPSAKPSVRNDYAPDTASTDATDTSTDTYTDTTSQPSLLIVPQPLAFGSEELSSMADAINARSEVACLWLHPDDAQRQGISDGDRVAIVLDQQDVTLQALLDSGQAPGTARVADGMPPLCGCILPQRSDVTRISANPLITSDRNQQQEQRYD
ncbi:MAG: NADH-quinone oxidoreductase subunit NuoG [Motiliproteus sp.]